MPLLLGALLVTMSALLLPNESLAQPRPDGIGVGMGFDVEYIAPQPFRDAGGKTSAWFPVKYVCGETQPGDRLVPGNYSTVINVLNLSKFIIRIGWWFSSGLGRAGVQGAQAEILGQCLPLHGLFVHHQVSGPPAWRSVRSSRASSPSRT